MLKASLFITSIFLLLVTGVRGQQLLTWETLGDVKFNKKFDPALGIEVLEADFGESVKKLEKQQVIIKGFMIPLDPLGTQYVLSKFPMAQCFFCGAAGPETVIELRLHPKSIRRYAMDEVHTFKGTLMLNANNSASLNYVITQAERM
jgi:hypothetical protein